MTNEVFLNPAVKVEPLVCHWYAWSQLISPVQLALNRVFRHIPLMQSFVTNPAIHTAATAKPEMLTANYINLPQRQVNWVAALLEKTLAAKPQLTLARDLKEFYESLGNAHGFSLNGLYASLPASLQGLVELVYDINHHASIRILEEFIDPDASQEATFQQVMLSHASDQERKFFINTPRGPSPEQMIFDIPYSSGAAEAIFRARTEGVSLRELRDRLRISPENNPLFESFFTPRTPVAAGASHGGEDVRIRYFGHACVLVQTASTAILLDPLGTWDASPPAQEQQQAQELTLYDLPEKIDYVVITHSHPDHFSVETLLQLRHRIGTIIVPRSNSGSICDTSMKLILRRIGFSRILTVDAGDSVQAGDCNILSLPFFGEHADLDIQSKHSVFINACGRALLFLTDSRPVDTSFYRRALARAGRVDALFIGMECQGAPLSWLYGPLILKPITRRNDESRRLAGSDSKCAWELIEQLRCPQVFVYAMGQEPWLKYLMGLQYTADSPQLVESEKLLAQCRAAGIDAQRLLGARELQWATGRAASTTQTQVRASL